MEYTQAMLETALEAHPQDDLVIVDLDESLWLRNSTEEFLDHARPRLLIATLLLMIDALRPWRVWGGRSRRAAFIWRDWLRVMLTVVLTPWNLWRWQRRAPAHAWNLANRELLDQLERHDRGRYRQGRLVVASFGFDPVIRPLLQGLLPDAPVVAPALFSGWRDRAAGKWHLLKARFDEASLRRAVFLTDHADHDADVVSEVQTPIIRRWPEARFIPACERTYAPFRYTFKGKHAGRNHLLRVFLGMDTLALMLASLPATSAPLSGAIGYFFLTLSFFLVYEIGYHENDVIAAEREREPILTDARMRELGGMVEWQAWGIAILIALPGLFLLAHQGIPTWSRGTWQSDLPWLVALWLGALVISRLVFAAFNRIEETTRTLLYLPLQATKGLGIVLLLGLPVTVAGIALLIAQAVSRWIPYVIYRTSSVRWQTPTRLYRLILLVMVFIAMLPVTGLWSDPLWATALVFGWCAIESRRELWQAWQRSHWLKQPVAAVGLLWVLEVAKIGGASLG